MMEIICCDCQCHLGWMIDAGPCGMTFCDDCVDDETFDDKEEQ